MTYSILHQSSWAKTGSGSSISLYESQNREENPFLLIGGVHGDEPEGVELAVKLLNWLQKNNIQNLHSWILIPCLNVDGFQENKRTNSMGVDLNRNFPSKDWSVESKGARYYPGAFPASENETQAVVNLIETRKPQLIVHFHSWEPCVVYTGEPGRWAAEAIAQDCKYKVSEDIGYPTPGSLGQYGWGVHGIPVVCIEEQEKAPLSEVWPRFESGLIRLLRRK